MKAHFSLTLALDRGGLSTPHPGRFNPGKDTVDIVLEAGWPTGPVCTGAESLAVTGIRSPVYTVSQEECARLSESVPYVKVYRYNPKHLYPKLNGYVDNGQRKVRSSCGSTYCSCSADALRVNQNAQSAKLN